jgi:tetratricopeptide (TPR) repeat protein
MFDQVEARWKRTVPTGHVFFASLASHRSLLTLARGDAPGALVQADQAVALAEANPAAHDHLKTYLLRRANLRMQLHMVEEARADAVRALALQQADVGTHFLSSLIGRAHLVSAHALHAEGQLEEARAEYASALEHLEPTLGKDHPDTLEAARAGY